MKNKITLTCLTVFFSLVLQAQKPGEAFKKYFKGPLKVSNVLLAGVCQKYGSLTEISIPV